MNLFQITTILALLTTIMLGVLVLVTSFKRTANRGFAALTVILAFWLFCMLLGATATKVHLVDFWIRMTLCAAIFIPFGGDVLRSCIVTPNKTFQNNQRRIFIWLLSILPLLFVCWTSSFIKEVQLPAAEDTVATPVYGKAFALYVLQFNVAVCFFIYSLIRDIRRATGVPKMELQFIVLGSAISLTYGTVISLILPPLMGRSEVARFLPYAILGMHSCAAYGIVRRRVMNVGDVVRRITAYSLLTAYLVILYMAVLVGLCFVLSFWFSYPGTFCHIVAAVVIAFSMAPAHGKMQKVTDRLFINMQVINERKALQQANEITMSISTTDEMIKRFANVLKDATGTDRVTIMLPDDNEGYSQIFPKAEPGAGLQFGQYEPLVTMLSDTKEPIGVDVLKRMRVTGARLAVLEQLKLLNTTVVIGIRAKGRLEGVLLLGPRISGKIYSAPEQDTLQMLCNELGVALENTRLYTDVQNSKIYNDILLDSLASGVIAIDNDKKVIVFNEKAQAITQMKPNEVIGHPFSVLPDSIVSSLDETLNERQKMQDEDVSLLLRSGDTVPARLSTSVFHGHTDDKLGALVVINDMTQLKVLEEQVRRTDRLSSLGTLSAGIAHEIKNPLVSIKTFTQLLPERYEDNEFRATFFDLIGREVTRIDQLVNRLLNFARPTKPSLEITNLHELLDDCLNLTGEQMRSQNIQLVRSFAKGTEKLRGDADLLKQAFVNFILNALQSMEDGGDLTVATTIVEQGTHNLPNHNGNNNAHGILISIKDTGPGIPAEDISRVFDPFFTTKSNGTGLGLAVSHGIIEEHGAMITISPNHPVGTCFDILFSSDLTTEDSA